MPAKVDTIGYYDGNATEYAVRMLPDPAGLAQLAVFCARLAPGVKVLDLGCGAGHFAAIMLEAGFDVDLLDGSRGLAGQAKAITGREVTIARYQELEARAVYDGVWASASLLHAEQDELPDILARIRASLKPGGLFYCSFKALDADQIDGLNHHYVRMSRGRLDALLEAAGFAVANRWTTPSYSAEGHQIEMVAAISRKISQGG